MTSPSEQLPRADLPLRVSTLELFFDLVFVFTITQLTNVLARDMSFAAAGQVLLIFGLLWWMYGGYAWLTSARMPSRAPERLLLLLGMAGFLIIGMSIPGAFGAHGARGEDGVAFGLGYLVVVAVHGSLYLRANRNFWRLLPFNLASPVLLVIAGLTAAPTVYVLWAAAFAVQLLGPVFVKLGGRFDIQPAHFVERHGGLLIVAFGESVVDIGIGLENHRVTAALALSASLGLALVAALWWAFFGIGDDDRAEQALAAADPARRPRMALRAYFYAYIPMLLGIVAIAAALKTSIGHPGAPLPTGHALALAVGVTLFLAGDALFRIVLGIGALRYRAGAAVLALAAWPVATWATSGTGIALLIVIVAGALAAESQAARDSVDL